MTRKELVGKFVKERPKRCRTVYEVRTIEDFGRKPYVLLVWETGWGMPKAKWVPLDQLRYYQVVGDEDGAIPS